MYIVGILDHARLIDTKTFDTPLEVYVQYSSSNGNLLAHPTLYHTIVANLIYPTITHLNIAYVVHIVS